MITRVLIAIILILLYCFIITLRLYFDEKKKAKNSESRAFLWHNRYVESSLFYESVWDALINIIAKESEEGSKDGDNNN